MYKYTVFRCPRCNRAMPVTSTHCEYCKSPIDANEAHLGMLKGAVKHSRKQLKGDLYHIGIGGGSFLLGSAITILSYLIAVISGSYIFIFWGLMAFGFGDLVYGIFSWFGDKREMLKLKREIKSFLKSYPYLGQTGAEG